MTVQQEMARLVRDELITLIQPVQLLSVNPNRQSGAVSGRFRSNGLLFDYTIGGGRVSYKPVGQGRKDSADAARLLIDDLLLSRQAVAARRRGARFDAPRKCATGYGCGRTCISAEKECRVAGGRTAIGQQRLKRLQQLAQGGTQGAKEKVESIRALRSERAKQLKEQRQGSRGAQQGGKGGALALRENRRPAAESQPTAEEKAKGKKSKGKAKGGATAGPGKAPSFAEVKGDVLKAFNVKNVEELKASEEFQMATATESGDQNPLESKEDWLKVYRTHVRVPMNERNLPPGPTVVNGIDVTKNFRPWTVFGLNPQTATDDDIRRAFRKTLMEHHPDRGGDPRMPQILKAMRDSLLAMRSDGRGSRRDGADQLLRDLRLVRRAIKKGWSQARIDQWLFWDTNPVL